MNPKIGDLIEFNVIFLSGQGHIFTIVKNELNREFDRYYCLIPKGSHLPHTYWNYVECNHLLPKYKLLQHEAFFFYLDEITKIL